MWRQLALENIGSDGGESGDGGSHGDVSESAEEVPAPQGGLAPEHALYLEVAIP